MSSTETKTWYKNPEMLIALSALFLGLLTAAISIYSAYVDRTYARASVWPRLELSRSIQPNFFSYNIVNNGTGPAIIKYAHVTYQQQHIKTWWDVDALDGITQSHMGSGTIPAGKILNPLILKGKATAEVIPIDKEISIELCYCSIYDECWLVNRTNDHRNVEQCEVDIEIAFER